MDLEDNLFMLPGPVKIHRRVLEAMSRPSMAHRSKDFSNVNAETRDLLKYLFQSEYDVALISGSGTAGVESAITSLLRKEDKVLNLGNGKFGERLNELSGIYAQPTLIKADWGEAFDMDAVAEELEKGGYKALTLCHNETSTALTNQAEEIGRLAKKHDVFYILDGITSVGGIPVNIEEWGADITIFGSQKCVGAPAGMAGMAVSPKAYDALLSGNNYYLDLKKHINKLRDGNQTPYTPAIPLFLAMRECLRMLKEEGMENRLKRIERLANATRAGIEALNLELFPDPKYASNTVTGIRYPEGIDDAGFRGRLREDHNLVIAGAQDHIKGKVFRIGHMGVCSFTDILSTFGAMESTLRKMGYERFDVGASARVIIEMM